MSELLAPHAHRPASTLPDISLTPPAARSDVAPPGPPRPHPLTIAPLPVAPAAMITPRTPYDWSWLPTLIGAPLGALVGLVTLAPAWIGFRYLLNPAAAGLMALFVAVGAGGMVFWLLVARPWRRGPRLPRR